MGEANFYYFTCLKTFKFFIIPSRKRPFKFLSMAASSRPALEVIPPSPRHILSPSIAISDAISGFFSFASISAASFSALTAPSSSSSSTTSSSAAPPRICTRYNTRSVSRSSAEKENERSEDPSPVKWTVDDHKRSSSSSSSSGFGGLNAVQYPRQWSKLACVEEELGANYVKSGFERRSFSPSLVLDAFKSGASQSSPHLLANEPLKRPKGLLWQLQFHFWRQQRRFWQRQRVRRSRF